MRGYIYLLREIAEHCGVEPVRAIALKPGTRHVYRVTVHYPDLHASDAIVTLVQGNEGSTRIAVVYRGRFGHKPLARPMSGSDFAEFAGALRRLRFDHLSDQPDILYYDTDLMMVERAAGGFTKDVVMMPQRAAGTYLTLLDTIRQYLPEALREIVRS